MNNELLEKLLIRALLVVSIALVELFNQLDDGDTDYVVTARPVSTDR